MVSAAADVVAPWLRDALDQTLRSHQGHALLVYGSAGDGSWDFATALGQAWLCEGAQPARPCGQCTACRLYRASAHPDQNWLVPQDIALRRGLPVEVKEGRKPSRQIRVDDVRAAIDALNATTGRGRGRVLVVFPGEAMNAIAASALLKTLEEPAPGTRIVISAAEPQRLLPTLRSRCQLSRLPRPTAAQATQWLADHGVPSPDVLLAASGGRPLDALALHEAGLTATAWLALPARLARGDAAALEGLSPPLMLDLLAKLCHDAMAAAVDGPTRYFGRDALPRGMDLARLSRWQREIVELCRHPDHPRLEALLAEAMAAQASDAMCGPTG